MAELRLKQQAADRGGAAHDLQRMQYEKDKWERRAQIEERHQHEQVMLPQEPRAQRTAVDPQIIQTRRDIAIARSSRLTMPWPAPPRRWPLSS